MAMIDFRGEASYKAKREPAIVEIPTMRFVLVDGTGGPEASESGETAFQEAMGILFGVVYTIKFWTKRHPAPPGWATFSLGPVEALWWTPGAAGLDLTDQASWAWTAMLRVPEFVDEAYFAEVVRECQATKRQESYAKARLEDFTEGRCVQIMHVGPYSMEAPTIERLHAYAAEQGLRLVGKHHELYFGDPRRGAPEKLKTILRQPVTSAA